VYLMGVGMDLVDTMYIISDFIYLDNKLETRPDTAIRLYIYQRWYIYMF